MPIEIDPAAVPSPEKWPRLTNKHSELVSIWDNTLETQTDRTPEGWDSALAYFAALGHWTDQEIADLLVAHRRERGHDLKLKNPQYFNHTILNAKREAQRSSLEYRRAEGHLERKAQIEKTFREGDPRRDVSLELGISVLAINKYVQDPPIYELVTPGKKIELGDVTHLIKQDKLRRRIAEYLGHYMPQVRPEHWQELAQLLLDICNDVFVSPESTKKGQMKAWLADYLDGKEEIDPTEDVAHTRAPFLYKDQWHIFGDSFLRFIKNRKGSNMDRREMFRVMRRVACEEQQVNFVVNGRKTQRSVWAVPQAIGTS